MNTGRFRTIIASFALAWAPVSAVISCSIAAKGLPSDEVEGSSYYTACPVFVPFPNDTLSYFVPFKIAHFGPVGVGIDLVEPPFTMRISNVEPGSPAAATGALKKGQIIETINDRTLKDIDPRVILGNIITEAEASDGLVRLKIKGEGVVTVRISLLGAYSKTWPLNCSKSDMIVRNLADVLAKQGKPKWGSVLFLLSTGEEKDLEVVRKWMSGINEIGGYPWSTGYLGLGICEYYLRTGDQSVLPVIKKSVDQLRALMYNGGWSGRGYGAFTYATGSGQMNAAGVHCLTFLLLARMCGVDVDEWTLQRSLLQFYRFAGHGNVPYGDQMPDVGFRDNGKTSGLAIAMGVAAKLTPDGEYSVYAKARDNCAMKGFYATSQFHQAHTGGGIGEIWHNAAMCLMADRRPAQYRSFLDERRWVMELSRQHDGSIGIGGFMDAYDTSATDSTDKPWGTYFALTYTLPRKKLQLAGAPRTEWCRSYALPQRPWGNAADDLFVATEPARHSSISINDLLTEKIPTDAVWPVERRLADPGVSDETLLKYLHHPEFGYRVMAIRAVVNQKRDHLILPLMQSSDPRVRHSGLLAITGTIKGGALPPERLRPEMFELAGMMIHDPNESLWVAQEAMCALKRADNNVTARSRDRLLAFLKLDDWMVRRAAIEALTPLATDPLHYRAVLPWVVVSFGEVTTLAALAPGWQLSEQLKSADPKIKALSVAALKRAYATVPGELVMPGGHVVSMGAETVREKLQTWASRLEGGANIARQAPKKTSRWMQTGSRTDMYVYQGAFEPTPAVVGKWRQVASAASAREIVAQLKSRSSGAPGSVNETERNRPETNIYLDLKDGGTVGDSTNSFWSGNMLVDIPNCEARKIKPHSEGGKDFLLVEKGGFKKRNASDKWNTGYVLYERSE